MSGANPAEVMANLDRYASELNDLGNALADVQRTLEPVEKEYDDAMGDHIAEWYAKYERGEKKWPGEDVRVLIARRHINSEVRDRYDALSASRKRLRERIENLSKSVSANQSILKALREEMGAIR